MEEEALEGKINFSYQGCLQLLTGQAPIVFHWQFVDCRCGMPAISLVYGICLFCFGAGVMLAIV